MASELTQLHQAQMAAILGPDPTHFETLVSHLMSTNNEQRSQAESFYNLCKTHQAIHDPKNGLYCKGKKLKARRQVAPPFAALAQKLRNKPEFVGKRIS